MTPLREYLKMRYMGDCKCRNCQLVPIDVLHEQIHYIDKLQDLVKTLLENDPSYPIADNGMTVLDGWRERARRVLALTSHVRGEP
jgi:hypothetical protein